MVERIEKERVILPSLSKSQIFSKLLPSNSTIKFVSFFHTKYNEGQEKDLIPPKRNEKNLFLFGKKKKKKPSAYPKKLNQQFSIEISTYLLPSANYKIRVERLCNVFLHFRGYGLIGVIQHCWDNMFFLR